jgi:hypothetical protein
LHVEAAHQVPYLCLGPGNLGASITHANIDAAGLFVVAEHAYIPGVCLKILIY